MVLGMDPSTHWETINLHGRGLKTSGLHPSTVHSSGFDVNCPKSLSNLYLQASHAPSSGYDVTYSHDVS